MSPSQWKNVSALYQVLASPALDFNNTKFLFCLIDNWQSPYFSTLFLKPGMSITADDLKDIENYFRKLNIQNPYVKSPAPYFNFFNSSDYDLEEIPHRNNGIHKALTSIRYQS